MMVVLLIAGIGFLLAGLLGIVFGIPVKEFSFGNTLIISGSVAACTGMITLGLWVVVRELRNIARQLGESVPAGSFDGAKRQAVLSAALGGSGLTSTGLASTRLESAGLSKQPRNEGGFLFNRPAAADDGDAKASPSPMPWREQAASRDRMRGGAPAAPEGAEAASAAKPRRNLFASSMRKERERAQSRTSDPSLSDTHGRPVAAPPPFESDETPPAIPDDAWSNPARPPAAAAEATASRRSAPSTFAEPSAGNVERPPPAAPDEEQRPPVMVLKSGVVDGMAYSLYSDGSIEAQMPEGMMRFASIDELRAHLDQRP
jgi:hypothetical protein